VSQSYQQHRPY